MNTPIVAIQGTNGSYHEQVAQEYFDESSTILYLATFKDVFTALNAGEATHAVVAIANNRYGFVPNAFSQLIQNSADVTIVGEAYLAIHHQLLALPGARLESITEVHSQPAALGQCNMFLSSAIPNAQLVEETDTAKSAELVSNSNDLHKAAIASKKAGELNKLVTLAANIQDDSDNTTRFLILKKSGSKKSVVANGNKTTALLKTSQEPGSLVDALLPFKQQAINISTLHSSFLPNTNFVMQFFIEFDASMSDPSMKQIVTQLNKIGAELTVLGTYVSNS